MKKPSVKHVVRAPKADITFTIYAYRKLTRDEIVSTVQNYQQVKYDILPNKHIQIMSMIGFDQ